MRALSRGQSKVNFHFSSEDEHVRIDGPTFA
jgi:hypothetical protein